jgi:subtilisin-like proprotein convertase family protein
MPAASRIYSKPHSLLSSVRRRGCRARLRLELLEERIVLSNFTEVEPNNTAATANAVPVATGDVLTALHDDWLNISGGIASSDVDFFQFTLGNRSGVFFDIDSRETGLSATLDSILTVFDAAGTTSMGSNDDGYDFDTGYPAPAFVTGGNGAFDSALYLDLNAGTYVVRVTAAGGSMGNYLLRLLADPNYASTVPVFESNPGAADTLFLDFDGHAASDAWGNYTMPPYDLNNNGAEFSPGEKLAIRNAWKVVAEDFSPFAVNVATSYTGSFTDGVAFRHVIGNGDGSIINQSILFLGIAFLHSYAVGGPNNNVAFTFGRAFPNVFGTFNGGSSGQIVAIPHEIGDVTSHEFGHALGLLHYGGTNPQPEGIMHTPLDGLRRRLWRTANTHSSEPPVVLQDDMAIISNAANTFGYRADDHGNTTATATVLSATGSVLTATGILSSPTTDLDVFRFAAAGPTNILVNLDRFSNNLDVELRLFDANGTLLETHDPGNAFDAVLRVTLAAGTYFVEVRSDGEPGEAGQYGLRIELSQSGISGQKFNDLNADGIKQAGEPGLAGWTIFLDTDNDGTLDTGETSTTTDTSGNYRFANLSAGTYHVREVLQTGWLQSRPGGPDFRHTVTLANGQLVADRDFGNYRQGEIRGTVFEDLNANGTRDAGDPGQAGFTVYLDLNNNGVRDQGAPTFLSTDVPKTIPDPGTVTSNLVVNGVAGRITDVNLTLNITHTWDEDLDVFLVSPGGTRVELFTDVDGDGDHFTFTTLDDEAASSITTGSAPFNGSFRPEGLLSALDGEDPNGTWVLEISDDTARDGGALVNWTLNLTVAEPSTVSTASGAYAFTGLNPGTYIIREAVPVGWVQSRPGAPDHRYTVTLTSSQAVTDRDFGNYRRGEIRGLTFEDLNANGTRDAGEPGLPGFTLYLDQNNNAALDQATLTASSTEVPRTVPDAGTTTSRLTVTKAAGRILDVNVTLNLTHPFDADLDVFLVSPAGTRVELFTDVGGDGANFTNTVLDDEATTAVTAGTAPFTGSFRPESPLAAVDFQDPNGVWTLEVSDDTATNTGTLNSWSLTFLLATEPATATNASGAYAFPSLLPGTYHVRQVVPAGWTQTRPGGPDFRYTVALVSSQTATDRDFGNVRSGGGSAPAVIEGINSDENRALFGSPVPQASPIGAAGPGHLVGVVNQSITWYSREGTRQTSQNLSAFFAALNPAAQPYDPKVVYDQYAGRFVVVAVDQTDTAFGGSANTSRLLVAVSDDSNPNGTWFYHAIDARVPVNGAEHAAEFPAVGLDAQALYVTGGLFAFGSRSYGGSRLWIVDKAPLYSGGQAAVTLHNPAAASGLPSSPLLQPAHLFGAGPGSVGTFLISVGWFTANGNDSLNVIRLDNPLTAPTFTNQFVQLGNIYDSAAELPAAPQRGSAVSLDTGSTVDVSVVWRDNTLWAAHTILPVSGPDAGQATVHWYRINTTNLGSLTLADQGNVGGEDLAPGTHTFFPALAVNAAGSVAIGFAASAATLFPGAYYTGRHATDAAGRVQATQTLAAGLDAYVRTDGGALSLWGEYSSVSVDPADDASFWAYNQYALTRASGSGDTGRWGTRFGRFTVSAMGGQGGTTGRSGEVSAARAAVRNLALLNRAVNAWLSLVTRGQGFGQGSVFVPLPESGWRGASRLRTAPLEGLYPGMEELDSARPAGGEAYLSAPAAKDTRAIDQVFRDFAGGRFEETWLG